MFIENDEPGDPFKVSDADTMLGYIAPEHKLQESITVFTKPGCPFCAKAKQNLIDKGLQYEEVVLGKDATTVSLRAVSLAAAPCHKYSSVVNTSVVAKS